MYSHVMGVVSLSLRRDVGVCGSNFFLQAFTSRAPRRGRWSQPRGQNFILDTKWKWGGVQDIQSITPHN